MTSVAVETHSTQLYATASFHLFQKSFVKTLLIIFKLLISPFIFVHIWLYTSHALILGHQSMEGYIGARQAEGLDSEEKPSRSVFQETPGAPGKDMERPS